MTERPCWCGCPKEYHVRIPIEDLNQRYFLMSHDLDHTEPACQICGDRHSFDPDYGGFLQYGIENASRILTT